ARVQHAGLVRLYSVGVEGERPFQVFELIEGARPLGEVLRERGLEERVRLVLEVVEALAHLHAHGVVHRDVKPENVLVDAQGRARLTDLGVGLDLTSAERLTQSGALLGTPSYMAPEQLGVLRAPIVPATDVWAAGVLLYEAVTDELPFAG